MIGRVTQQTVQRSTLANLQLNLGKMADLQGRMSGGKVITKPSDDPAGTAQAMVLRAETRATEQFQRNGRDGIAWLTTVDTAMQSSVALLRRARDLTVQSESGAMSVSAREAIAQEIEGVRDSLVDQANTSYLGRAVFAGTSDAGYAFDAATSGTPYAWTGTAGASVQRRVAPDTTVRADADGSVVFGQGAGSVFALLDQIATDVRSGASTTGYLDTIDTRLETMLGELAGVGSRYNQITTATTAADSALQDLTSRLSGIEDMDLAATILELQTQEVAYKGALGATSRVLQPTLMDFLR